MSVKQISVFLENRSGRLYELCDELGKAGINMRALSIGEAADFGIVRMIVNDPAAARKMLADAGFTVAETDVLAVEIPDVPGGLAKVLGALKDKGINVEYAYAFVARSGDKAIVSMRVEDVDAAEFALTAAGYTLLDAAQLQNL
ncbi:MAG: ACT domain-containing protein [Actinomycetota bacterium]